jgi:aryl-alcohol dehydrogenase-like predicted oxidoreductase
MKKVELGNTGKMVSTLCLGAMYLGTRQNESQSFALLDQFVAAGGNFIDTANIYAWWVEGFQGGESESLIGAWFKERRNRQKVFLATKVGFGYQDVPVSLRADIIERECNKSLKRLGIETIDLYYAHNDDRDTPLEESLEAFYRLVKAGKVRYIGASNTLAWRLEEARWISQTNGWPTYQCLQQRHTYIRKKHGTTFDPQVAVNEDLLDYCRNRKLTLLAYSALLSGAYTRAERFFGDQYLGADSDNRLASLNAVATELGVSPNQVILAWMLQSDPPVLPLIAASNREQMDENIGALEIDLSSDQMSRLNAAGP